METPSTYIPMDRRQAIAQGGDLPDRAHGAALFADISGFTPLTEALLAEYGPKRGAEELTKQLNLIYDALVTTVHRYGGSILAFSGDAVTCWFDGDDGWRATVCGLAMQQAMGRFTAIQTPSGDLLPLAMKVGLAAGPVRRFQVGDPQIQLIDTLAGATLDEMAEAEHHAQQGDVVVSGPIVARIKGEIQVETRSQAGEATGHFGRAIHLSDPAQADASASPWSVPAADALPEEKIRPWVLPPIYERLRLGRGRFLAELRPAVILFLYFQGIDYDTDEAAGDKLDAYIRWVQSVLARYEGYIFQLTIGDKGSYLYTAFGAPIAHEDDAIRAVSAALQLQRRPAELAYIADVKIGISQGQIYAGAYGGTMRRTYGVLGDEVNLAARLMQAAPPGQIFVSESAYQATADRFTWERLPPLRVKGKSQPVQVFRPEGRQIQRVLHLQEPAYALPMVGRTEEMTLIEDKLAQVFARRGQIIAVTAEAGMGKSRLVSEVIRLAAETEVVGYGGECQSYGTNISYLVWEPIWRGFFGLDATWPPAEQISELEKQLAAIDSALVPRLPLLGTVLNLDIPDNDLTRSFDAKLRKTSLESLLVDCLRAYANTTPVLLVLEDCHWLDPLSHDLLEVIGRTLADLPVLLVMAYRPLQLERLREARLEKLPYFTEIELNTFSPEEAERLISLKLEQFFGAQSEVPPALLERITDRAQGNPFYIEELLNYLRDQNIDPHDTKTLAKLDLPTSLHSLILSRIDQLTEQQKSTLKVASVIGRLFEAVWLWGMYPELGEPEQVKADLEALHHLDLAPQDKPEPELTYIFKHIVTQEVAYESLPYATRAMLHNQLGQFIERTYPQKLERLVNILAFHYDRSENEAKKREYLRKAGAVAQADYANEAAIDYYQRVLPLLPAEEKGEVILKLGDILQLLGRWDEAQSHYEQALALAEQAADESALAWGETALGILLWRQGDFAQATQWLDQARERFEALGDQAGVGQIWHYEGTISAQQGNLEAARTLWERSLAIRQSLNDQVNIANLYNNLAIVARNQGNYEAAREKQEQALSLRYDLGDKRAIAVSLNNLGQVLTDLGEYEMAQMQLEVAVDLQREIGDKWEIANALHTLATALRDKGDYEAARAKFDESLSILWALGERWMLAYVLEDMGGLAALQGDANRALRLVGAAATLRESTGASRSPAEQAALDALLAPARHSLADAADEEEAAGRAWPLAVAVAFARG